MRKELNVSPFLLGFHRRMAGILATDPLTQLAFSVYENKGIYAVLIGSGLSRAAEIPTGWEITLDLIRRVAVAQGVDEQPDWAAWYRAQTGEEPNYSALLEELSSSPEERRSILHSYIEPTPEEQKEAKKVPTAAHKAIAELVRGGYFRVIVTTNFDRLMENALREAGIEPTIVASRDALIGAEPLTHSSCYVLKLHGDYKDARILNTDAELNAYPPQYDSLLDRMFDEYGLLVCGWSGAWDHALKAAFFRTKNRRYPVYWAARGKPNDGAQDIINHRRARFIEIKDADNFFPALAQRVQTLEQSHRRNPIGVELLVGSAKRYLGRPEHRIQLDELFAEEADRMLALLNAPELAPQGAWSEAEFRTRVSRYESATEAMARMAGVLGRWGDGSELPLVLDIIKMLRAYAATDGSGLVAWINIRVYPAALVFTAYGLGLTRAARWKDLHRFLAAELDHSRDGTRRVVEELFLHAWEGADNNFWQHLDGLDRRKTALSDHLLAVLGEWSGSFVAPDPDFETLFEHFEVLCSLSYLESSTEADLAAALQNNSPQRWIWTPVGRSGWHTRVRERLLRQITSPAAQSALLQAGFANGSENALRLSIGSFNRIAGRMEW